MIDLIATEGHFLAHLAPIRAALPDSLRGAVVTDPDVASVADPDVALVASYGDHKRARRLGYRRIVRAEHGIGQSYGGDEATATIANYAGGRDADDVSMFLVPGPHPAQRWRAAYPSARIEVVGSPRLDDLPGRTTDEPIVAISTHFTAFLGCPEGDGAFRWYRDRLRELGGRFRIVGHAHPRHAARVASWYRRAGLEFVSSFDEVCRRAAVYVCDNSSTIFEFASTGRPVVVLDSPAYRPNVRHGLRFYDAAHVGIRTRPQMLVEAIERALEDGPDEKRAREHALALVYAHRHGAAARAAAAIADWLRSDSAAAA